MELWLGEQRASAEHFTLGFVGHRALSAADAAALLRHPLVGLAQLEVEGGAAPVRARSAALEAEWTLDGARSQLAVRCADPAAGVQSLEALAAMLRPQTVTLADAGGAPCAPVPFMPVGLLFVRHLLDAQTPFQRIQVGEHPLFGRVLFLNGETQIASSDERAYTEGFVAGALRPGLRRAMVLGGGDCGVVRELLAQGVEKVLMIEIDEEVVRVCAEYFPDVVGETLSDPRATIRYGDAFAYLRDRGQRIDLIVYDLSDAPLTLGDYGPVLPLIKRALAPGGRVAMQCGSGMPEDRARLEVVLEGLRAEFGNCTTRDVDVPSFVQRPWVFAYADLLS
ncbi:MAG: hypothetical protein KDD82_12160 [Planctomycetes bacterium]|nr:hypothetical protein [Planctomycetota bacterium]